MSQQKTATPTTPVVPAPVVDAKLQHKTNKIQVSNQKQPIRFYVNLCKKMLKKGEPDVELSGLGNAIHTVVTCVEILKNANLVDVKSIQTSSVTVGNNTRRLKPKLQVFVLKSKNFDKIIEQQEREQAERAQQKAIQQPATTAPTTATTTTNVAVPKQ